MAKLRIKDLEVGKQYILSTNRYTNYGCNNGTIVTLLQAQQGYIQIRSEDSGQIFNVNVSDLTEAVVSKEQIQEKITKFEGLIKIEKDKLDWMVKTNAAVYDETEFKVWSTLQTLSSSSTDIEKAKVIAALIKK